MQRLSFNITGISSDSVRFQIKNKFHLHGFTRKTNLVIAGKPSNFQKNIKKKNIKIFKNFQQISVGTDQEACLFWPKVIIFVGPI